mmetsp:Transcript_21470/g.33872  ORF Transcript_21470/g.33872 Transcript_21470/m.33872 type:complete len:214 (-) Transcript_21470:149-790(-)
MHGVMISLIYLAVAFQLFWFQVVGFSINVRPGERECFMLDAKAGDVIAGNFEVLSEVPPDPVTISVTDSSPQRTVLFEASGEEEGVFQFEATAHSPFVLCLQNGAKKEADKSERLIGFAFRVASTSAAEGDEAGLVEHFAATLDDLDELVEYAATIQNHQEYMRQREEMHRDVVESTCDRVLYWTVAEAVVLLGLAVWQVTYIRQFFEVKRAL